MPASPDLCPLCRENSPARYDFDRPCCLARWLAREPPRRKAAWLARYARQNGQQARATLEAAAREAQRRAQAARRAYAARGYDPWGIYE
jgi:hypothetical protein